MPPTSPKLHPCQTCGACCTSFEVSFPVTELSENSFHVPENRTFKIDEQTRALKTLNKENMRCQSLEGHLGKMVSCRIYNNRPSPCRNFKASFEDGIANPRCDQVRQERGMKPLTKEDWT